MNSREKLTRHLQEDIKVFKSPEIKKAFEKIDRADFVSDDYKNEAYEDYPLSIGYGQTISQPTTVAFMLELLEPAKGNKILDVGSGSGWTTALLSEIVGDEGNVTGIEIVPELVYFGQKNLAKYGYKNSKIVKANEKIGLKSEAPYDRILVSACFENKIPAELVNQLKIGGIIAASVDDSICKIEKISEEKIKQICYEGFAFVPYKYTKI